jgi:hypothetical protein
MRFLEVSVERDFEWLWTWSGACFGYRREMSLFSHDGLEVGRFFGTEVYGADGQYIGELSAAGDGPRLITNVYKRSRTYAPFVPATDRLRRRLKDRVAEPLYTGHEDFPSPDIAKRRRQV